LLDGVRRSVAEQVSKVGAKSFRGAIFPEIIKLSFHVQQNKLNAATILQALAVVLQHTLILFYCT